MQLLFLLCAVEVISRSAASLIKLSSVRDGAPSRSLISHLLYLGKLFTEGMLILTFWQISVRNLYCLDETVARHGRPFIALRCRLVSLCKFSASRFDSSVRFSSTASSQKLFAYILWDSVVSEESTTAAKEKSGLKMSLKKRGQRCSSRVDFQQILYRVEICTEILALWRISHHSWCCYLAVIY